MSQVMGHGIHRRGLDRRRSVVVTHRAIAVSIIAAVFAFGFLGAEILKGKRYTQLDAERERFDRCQELNEIRQAINHPTRWCGSHADL